MDWHARARAVGPSLGSARVGTAARVESATYCLDPDSSRSWGARGTSRNSKWTAVFDARDALMRAA